MAKVVGKKVPGIVRPTVDQTMAFFEALFTQLGIRPSTPYIAYSAGAMFAWLEDPSETPVPQPDTLEALRIGTFVNRLGEQQIDENPALYDVARKVCHDMGMPWTDPRTGVTYAPPDEIRDK